MNNQTKQSELRVLYLSIKLANEIVKTIDMLEAIPISENEQNGKDDAMDIEKAKLKNQIDIINQLKHNLL